MQDQPVTGGTLTKAALVELVADVGDLTKKRAEVIVETVFGTIAESLRRGEKVELRGFGSFRLRRREPHSGRNPRTGDRVGVPSKRVALGFIVGLVDIFRKADTMSTMAATGRPSSRPASARACHASRR